jgi:hypothetical protein
VAESPVRKGRVGEVPEFHVRAARHVGHSRSSPYIRRAYGTGMKPCRLLPGPYGPGSRPHSPAGC